MFKILSNSVLFQSSLTDFSDIFKLVDNYYSKIEEFSRELAAIQNDIDNISYNTGLFLILFVVIDIIILITVFQYFRRKESYEKVSRRSIIIALIIAIPSFIYGYSFYDRPYTKEYSIPPYYGDAKTYAAQVNKIESHGSKNSKDNKMMDKLSWEQYLDRRNLSIRDVENKVGELKHQGYQVLKRDDTRRGKVVLFISPPITSFALVGIWFGLQGFLFALIICQATSLAIVWIKNPSEEENNEQ
ncbi:MAG: hypothetical protein ACYC6G_01275 [Desulfobaccales bacterium]